MTALETFIDNGDQEIDTDGGPDLGFHGVFGGTEEGFDAQVLFDPFEEQLVKVVVSDMPCSLIGYRFDYACVFDWRL